MSVVASSNLVVSPQGIGLTADHPIVGWHNIVTTANLAASSEDSGYPATNLGNPATHLRWRAASASPQGEQEITVTTGYVDEIDYLAVARHNFSSNANAVRVGYYQDGSPDEWVDLVGETMLPDDGPALFRFNPQSLETIVLRIAAGSDTPEIGALYVGKLIVLPRTLWQRMTPPPMARASTVVAEQT